MTYQQTIFGEEQALNDQPSSAEAFPASRFPWLESKKAKGTTVISGRKCSELSESLRRVGSSVRTYLESCALPLTTFVRTWSVRATTSEYLILKLRLSERRTGESESRLWLTPNAMDALDARGMEALTRQHEKNRPGRTTLSTLREQVVYGKLWPTPTTRDYKDGSAQSCANVPVNGLLGRAVHMMPTPNARDWKNATAKEWDNPKNTRNLNRYTAKHFEGSEIKEERLGQLNPTWVEWLMGFPLGWTDLNASETP